MARKLILLAGLAVSLAACQERPASPNRAPEAPFSGTKVVADGREIVAPADSTVTIETENSGPGATYNETSAASGTGLKTSSGEVAQKFAARDVSAALGPRGAVGGGFQYSGTLSGVEGINLFHALGAIFIIAGGIFYAVTKRLGTSAMIAGAGLAFIAIGVAIKEAPMLWIAGLIVLACVLGAWIFLAWKNKQVKADNTEVIGDLNLFGKTVVQATNKLSPAAKDEFKKAMEASAGDSLNARIRQVMADLRAQTGV